ncbi:MAG: hypothetical protein RL042_2244 [Nitrospirota bacterium]
MPNNSLPPWASGPGEILRHGLGLLREDTDTNRRLAMIAIDNAVELTIKTYLGLPKRITGLHVPRKELSEISESFPALLDAIERHAHDKLLGIDLGEIEWYHRLRNELYHQGNGLTVERDKVNVYAQLANVLFKNLFGIELVHPQAGRERLLGDFLEAWIDLERSLVSMAQDHSPTGSQGMSMLQAARFLRGTDLVSKEDVRDFERLQQLRNKLVHGIIDDRDALTPEIINQVRQLREKFSEE